MVSTLVPFTVVTYKCTMTVFTIVTKNNMRKLKCRTLQGLILQQLLLNLAPFWRPVRSMLVVLGTKRCLCILRLCARTEVSIFYAFSNACCRRTPKHKTLQLLGTTTRNFDAAMSSKSGQRHWPSGLYNNIYHKATYSYE